tara:strand:+ start:37 stop:309 length:273 start_codon:yes stop_codon:yes gene_type:complete
MSRNFQDPNYKEWRKKVFARDKFSCQWPNCVLKSKLNAHHIKKWADNPGLRFLVANGITLCHKHHKMIHGNEEVYAALFLKILYDKHGRL